MPNTVELVRRAIERDGAIKRDLARGLINVRALARLVQRSIPEEEIGDDGGPQEGFVSGGRAQSSSLDAIISAIRRYPIKRNPTLQDATGNLLKKLAMRNKIVDVAILNDPDVPAALGKFASKVDYSRGETFRVVAGVELVRVVIDERNVQALTSIVPRKNIRKITSGLAEIIISLADGAEKTPGVVSAVTSELAMHGINMVEFMSCVPELIIVVDEADALRSYDALEKLSNG